VLVHHSSQPRAHFLIGNQIPGNISHTHGLVRDVAGRLLWAFLAVRPRVRAAPASQYWQSRPILAIPLLIFEFHVIFGNSDRPIDKGEM
jgi:hypothetical protein